MEFVRQQKSECTKMNFKVQQYPTIGEDKEKEMVGVVSKIVDIKESHITQLSLRLLSIH